MTHKNDFSHLDSELLAAIRQSSAQNGDGASSNHPLEDFCAQLASVTPQADDVFRQQLEEQLLEQLQKQQTVHPAEARLPQTQPALVTSLWQQIFQVFNITGDLTMRKAIVLTLTVLLAAVVGTIALVPAVRAQVTEVIRVSFMGMEPPFLSPHYIPAGFESVGIINFGADGDKYEIVSLETILGNGQQFITISQQVATDNQTLPEGRPVTVQEQPSILQENLSGTVQVGVEISRTEDESTTGQEEKIEFTELMQQDKNEDSVEMEMVEGFPVESTPIMVDYTNAYKLIWYTDKLKVEILTNLPEAELFKIAESMKPNSE